MNSIPTFVINLKNRTDRKAHILNEFAGRDEFKVTIVEPQKNNNPALSLWQTIRFIIENELDSKVDFFLLCEDDHQFTDHYQKDKLAMCIEQANQLGADILSGGVSSIIDFVQVNSDIFWMDAFSGLQFTIIYKRFYNRIITSHLKKNDVADLKIAKLSKKKFFVNPFISTQKEFGYSDVTSKNNLKGRIDWLFKQTPEKIKIVQEVATFYRFRKSEISNAFAINDYQHIYIPTYVINLPEREDRLTHIKKQFEGKNEFDIKITEAIRQQKGNLGLWLTIRKIVQQAIMEKHDIIILCEDDHEFTGHYSKTAFVKNVIEAHLLGAGILLGGISKCGIATLATTGMFWVDRFFCTQFTVIYRSLFKRILDEPFDDQVAADIVFSKITSNKLVTFPFVSTQKHIGQSDISPFVFKEGQVDKLFQSASSRFEKIKKTAELYPYDQ